MRKVIAATFLSIDGVMQAPGGPEEDTDGGFRFGGWTFHYWDEMMGKVMDESFGKPFDLLLGRRTYDIFAAHWPRVPEDDPIGKKFNAITKYVATSSPTTLSWKNSEWLGEDAVAGVAKLKQQDGPDLLIQGSSQFVQALLKNDLIDEYKLWTFPVVLGGGKRLFGEGSLSGAMKLVDSKVSTTGVVIGTYVRDGEVKQGSFALE
ncbi:dihydrofolate reductase family protein [Mesorhizobium sp. LHD-90]|uniref:dihydrofolate reductase family protein n=1 Tax=Mesorhizobium sp. LHD-90 TaxID=3071414 RepID=UPI0027DF89F7|nr:dihydrofolate reductase family protein [Mesorhizobium sp. LHD-90]MDQ6435944.1 dihydrofolate reductase family protein [Mesorhizobium sp. LHD-90]